MADNDMSVILASSGYDQTVKFWEALSGVCSRTIQHQDGQVNRMVITPDKKYLACAGARTVRLYDIKSNNPNPTVTFEGHTNNVTALAVQAESKWMVTASEDGTVKVWDMRAATVQRNYRHKTPVNDVVIHPNQGEVISCDQEGNVRIWDLGENICTHHLIPEEDVPVRSVSVASNGTMLVAGNNNGNCYVWKMLNSRDITSLHPITRFRSHSKYITKVLLSPDVKHLATCSADHTSRIWSTENDFKMETVLRGHQRWVWDCAFTADSAYLVTACSDHYVRLWELSSGQIARQYRGHHKGVISVALNDI
ncbi:Target of rapamycin complex subunit LST8 [Wickerhamiella sorbophila]|uniref:Target of rapamycin complex subunit LST8 n=1 Tax=Wickerhamiella sorbophila TaxID=45607 RepID=A0A2T0FHF5_9ASCO|nr:Target of rapamycin complex subunit LST8 [Wickerhamiella sorbophila]PRT54432.1 Target of rapamycin complex subunit LST8 [Wickerhamiella sorbophila]